MTDNNENNGAGARKPLSLNRNLGAGGTVRQSFSHGRSKTVVVEVKKKRGLEAPKPAGDTGANKPAPAFVPSSAAKPTLAPRVATPNQQVDNSHSLSEHERQARQAALAQAREAELQRQERERREAEARAAREEMDRKRREEEERLERIEQERLKREEEARAAEMAKSDVVEKAQAPVATQSAQPVSYTHLDVYKRQS